MKSKILFLICFVSVAKFSFASEYKDLDGDGNPDKLAINIVDGVASVFIESTKASEKKNFSIDLTNECGQLVIYPAGESGSLFVDQSCNGRQAQVYKELYSWSDPLKSWVMQEIIQGESVDQVNGILPLLKTQDVECCTTIEKNSGEIKIKKTDQSAVEINKNLEKISTKFKNKNLITSELKHWSFNMSIKLSEYYSDNNLCLANDMAYYLWKESRFLESAIILDAIVLKHPDRVVALLNLADALWDLESDAFKKKAKEYYISYNIKMQSANKLKLVPPRVAERISNH